MRVTNRDLYYQLVKDIGNNTESLLRLNKQISSAKRVHRPSEDPVGMASVLGYRTELNAIDQFKKDINFGNGWISRTDTILQDVDDLLGRASELATSQASDTATAATRQGAAKEIRQITSQIIGLANSKYGNKYMFGGTMTQTPPFLEVNVDAWVADVGTIAAAAPAAPAMGDRYINSTNNHIYAYDGTAWTDQGAPAAGTVVQVDDQGDELYVYNATSGWMRQYQGNDASFSVKIGKTDTVEVNIPGDEVFRNTAGDIFKTLMRLERAMQGNDADGIRQSLADITASSQVLANNLSSVGARVNRFEHTQSVLEKASVDSKERMSEIEDLDFAEAITAIQNQQTIYQATLKSAAMITEMSLVDFI